MIEMKKYYFVVVLFGFLSTQAYAKSYPIGGGVFPIFGQAPDTDAAIKGIRINPGWGYHKLVYGLDLSAVGGTTSSQFVGMQLAGGFNTNLGKTVIIGLQAAGVMNRNGGATHIGGIQVAFGFNSAGKGKTNVYGLQFASANIGQNNIYGVQAGFYNYAASVRGIQFGFVNIAKSLKGIQIGLANFADNGVSPFLPGINIGF
jgi:hypothetical protein